MAKVTDLVAAATQMLHEQKFCDDFIRKYVAIWRKLQIYAQKYRIDEFSWDLARTFLHEEYSIDIEGDDIYSADCKKVHINAALFWRRNAGVKWRRAGIIWQRSRKEASKQPRYFVKGAEVV